MQVQRIERIGLRLFGVASCIVSFGDASAAFAIGERSMGAIEAAFCDSIPIANDPVIVMDARVEGPLSKHRSVMGAPYIRFFAAQPIFNGDQQAVGSVNLIDYTARDFEVEDRQMLADLAKLVELELRVSKLNESQLDLQKKNRNLRRESMVDPLIGTWNRAAITRLLTLEADRCGKEQKPLSLVFVDIDSFKAINDSHGHPAGDTVLLKAASRLRSCIRPHDALGRYEGEKFMVVLPGASHIIAMAVAERMRLAVMSQVEQIGNTALKLTVSCGTVSTDRFPSATTEELIIQADCALRAAKQGGRNCVVQAVPPST
ncbi:diguanylate cyclase [Undibacterium arcticum]|uniref:sensor domain-containing diguanylate cyclase n=1 Tax=Undibacterium arcticum TaxID=1762892 RepID=UPI003606259D